MRNNFDWKNSVSFLPYGHIELSGCQELHVFETDSKLIVSNWPNCCRGNRELFGSETGRSKVKYKLRVYVEHEHLNQHGLTTIDLWVILQKRDILRAASNKVIVKTTIVQDVINNNIKWKLVRNCNCYTIVSINLFQISISGGGLSDTIVLHQLWSLWL